MINNVYFSECLLFFTKYDFDQLSGNSVSLAKLLFPMEARVAMDIAQVDVTSEFSLARINKNLADAQRTTVDLNETPFSMKEEHLNRMRALSRTGKVHLEDLLCLWLLLALYMVLHLLLMYVLKDKRPKLLRP